MINGQFGEFPPSAVFQRSKAYRKLLGYAHPMQALSLETLADLAKARYGLAAYCLNCNRWHDFDIEEPVERHGDCSIVSFKPIFSVCGERASKQVSPPMPRFEGYPK